MSSCEYKPQICRRIDLSEINFSEDELLSEMGDNIYPENGELLFNYMNRIEFEFKGIDFINFFKFLTFILDDGKIDCFDDRKDKEKKSSNLSIRNAIYLRDIYNNLDENKKILKKIFKIFLEHYDPKEVYSDLEKRKKILPPYVDSVSGDVMDNLNPRNNGRIIKH